MEEKMADLCPNCEIYDDALDLALAQVREERRKRRQLLQTIRLLRQEIVRNLENEQAVALCQADGFADGQTDLELNSDIDS
jgi:NMD protein affecting ribosome stability and mRNA decay